jgi:hypothetical protein
MAKRLPDHVLDYFRKEGARGAKLQAAAMTPEQRTARAIKASKAAALARTKKKQLRKDGWSPANADAIVAARTKKKHAKKGNG